ncbi:MAG TPA: hypothetical protein VGI39_12650, partial [Polyangiaceae bacterium]
MSALPQPLGGLVEFFTLSEATRQAGENSDPRRQALARALAIAAQKREAAEALWPRGNVAEALALARAATGISSRGLDAFAAVVDPMPPALAAVRELVTSASARVTGAALPE